MNLDKLKSVLTEIEALPNNIEKSHIREIPEFIQIAQTQKALAQKTAADIKTQSEAQPNDEKLKNASEAAEYAVNEVEDDVVTSYTYQILEWQAQLTIAINQRIKALEILNSVSTAPDLSQLSFDELVKIDACASTIDKSGEAHDRTDAFQVMLRQLPNITPPQNQILLEQLQQKFLQINSKLTTRLNQIQSDFKSINPVPTKIERYFNDFLKILKNDDLTPLAKTQRIHQFYNSVEEYLTPLPLYMTKKPVMPAQAGNHFWFGTEVN